MAETPSKRLRLDPHVVETSDYGDSNSNSKRQKPYNSILSLLDEDEENEEHNQDLSALFTTLQQELSSSADFDFDNDSPTLAAEDEGALRQQAAEEDEGVKSVMRHLLEASDDELGIPNCAEENNNVGLKSDENISLNFLDNGLWEFEDVAANYYTVLQSELFM